MAFHEPDPEDESFELEEAVLDEGALPSYSSKELVIWDKNDVYMMALSGKKETHQHAAGPSGALPYTSVECVFPQELGAGKARGVGSDPWQAGRATAMGTPPAQHSGK